MRKATRRGYVLRLRDGFALTNGLTVPTAVPLVHQPAQEHYHGIPTSLVLALVEVYYENLYNATLLLHKRQFLESLASGTARPHIVLGVCASAANSDSLLRFEPAADLENLALPWPEEDFEDGVSHHPRVTMKSERSSGGIFPEIIKIFTLWYVNIDQSPNQELAIEPFHRTSVLACIKTSDPDLSVRVATILALDQKLSDWWQKLHHNLKLTPRNISSYSKNALPKVLLLNVAYHQSLCALHASIVPIFCWGDGDESWLTARQLSAQRAYEHACAASELLRAVLSLYDRIGAMPSFISYAAYCGCAIQMPFLWSSNPAVKERAVANVRANVQMIHSIADYWKFAALLKLYVRCLHTGHKKHPIILDNEPKYIDPRKLTSFKINIPHAQASILEFSSILRGKDGGYLKPGEEAELEIEQDSGLSGQVSRESTAVPQEASSEPVSLQNPLPLSSHNDCPQGIIPSSSTVHAQYQQEQQPQCTNHMLSALASQPSGPPAAESQNLDLFHPLFDPEMLELFPNGDLPDLALLDTSPLSLDYLDMAAWNGAAAGTRELAAANTAMSDWTSVQ
ncbi:hypothetical protein MMC13_000194 [Lambiella insularis]|nr:hypothetical protein [Lambiella insularis]